MNNKKIEVEIFKNMEILDNLVVFVPYKHVLDHPVTAHERSNDPLELSVSRS